MNGRDMRFLEIIEIRTTENMRNKLIAGLKEIEEEVNNKEGRNIMKFFLNTKIKNDFSVHIKYESENEFNKGSRLGLTIISSFKRYGLINHNIWIRKSIKGK